MEREACIDGPGALHHDICRGIERRKIFWEDFDREDFTQQFKTHENRGVGAADKAVIQLVRVQPYQLPDSDT